MPRKREGPKKRPRNDLSHKGKKVAKKKATAQKKQSKKAPKTRNGGTMTEAAFWAYIRSTLRKKSMFWRPILECRNSSRREYSGPNKRQKWEYLCGICNKYHHGKEVVVHHINDCGTLTCADDLPGFVERLFCERDGLKVVCKNCHKNLHKTDE